MPGQRLCGNHPSIYLSLNPRQKHECLVDAIAGDSSGEWILCDKATHSRIVAVKEFSSASVALDVICRQSDKGDDQGDDAKVHVKILDGARPRDEVAPSLFKHR